MVTTARVLAALFALTASTAIAQTSLDRGLYFGVSHRSEALMFSGLGDDVLWTAGHRFGSGIEVAVHGSHDPHTSSSTSLRDGVLSTRSSQDQRDRYGATLGYSRPVGSTLIASIRTTVIEEDSNRRSIESLTAPREDAFVQTWEETESRLSIATAVEVGARLRVLGPIATAPSVGVGFVIEPWTREQLMDDAPAHFESDVRLSAGPYVTLPMEISLPRSMRLSVDASVGIGFTRWSRPPFGERTPGALALPTGSVSSTLSF